MVSHKHGKNGLLARTSSSRADVLQMAAAVASSQQTDFFRDLGAIRVESRNEKAIDFVVLGGLGGKFRQIAFSVSVGTDNGSTTVRTRISFFRTSQNTILGFIPAGPKLMARYATYRLFLERLSSTLKEADRGALISISDTADTDRIPAASPQVGS